MNSIKVIREFQTGARSVFWVRDHQELIDEIEYTRRLMRENGDIQGVTYSVATKNDALALGCYDTFNGEMILEGSELRIRIDR